MSGVGVGGTAHLFSPCPDHHLSLICGALSPIEMGGPTGKALPSLPRPACLASLSARCSPLVISHPRAPPSACNIQTFKAQFKWHLPTDVPHCECLCVRSVMASHVVLSTPSSVLWASYALAGILCQMSRTQRQRPFQAGPCSEWGKESTQAGARAERQVLASRGKRS